MFYVFGAIAIAVFTALLALSAWLCIIARGWLGWTAYWVLTLLILAPTIAIVLYCEVIDPRAHAYSGGLGAYMVVFGITGPAALCWLFGCVIGLVSRSKA